MGANAPPAAACAGDSRLNFRFSFPCLVAPTSLLNTTTRIAVDGSLAPDRIRFLICLDPAWYQKLKLKQLNPLLCYNKSSNSLREHIGEFLSYFENGDRLQENLIV